VPQLLSVIREGYRRADLRADAVAGLTVAIVALPLSMAIAIASGVGPERGLYTAVIGGFLVSALGGSRHQIGGPAGAFIVLVAATVAAHGLDGLLLAVLLSGAILTVLGLLRLGSLVRFMPHAVTVGFTAGIAVIILASQLKDLFGLTLAGPEPGPIGPKLLALLRAAPTAGAATIAVGFSTLVVIFALRQWRPRWPAFLIGVVLASGLVTALGLPVATLGSRFGTLPSMLPAPHLPPLSWAAVETMLPAALSFTLLGAIESLLSAVVADGMTGGLHRSNVELAAQGVANVASALFGGICVTGTIARTATNVRAGAHTPVAGIIHAALVLLFLMVAGPLARAIPLAALAAVLIAVCWSMADRPAVGALLRGPGGAASVLVVTFGLVVARGLVEGIFAGCVLAALFALRRRFYRHAPG